MRASLAHSKEALAIWEDIDQHPKGDDQGEGLETKTTVGNGLSETHTRVGATYLRLGDVSKAAPHFHKALALRRAQLKAAPGEASLKLSVARSLLAVGDSSFRLKDTAAAKPSFDEAIALCEEVMHQLPKVLAVKLQTAEVYNYVGDFCLRSGDKTRAGTLFRQSLALSEELVKANARVFDFQWNLGLIQYRLGLLALRSNDPTAAQLHFQKCLEVREPLAARDKVNERRQMELMLVLAHVGEHKRAVAIAEELKRTQRGDSEFLIDVARTYAQCAAVVSDKADLKTRYEAEAIRALRQAVDRCYRR